MLEVEGLNAWYGAARILFDLSLHVGRGEVVALMGRNGAGKSTTMKALMALLPRRSGTVRFCGEDISRLRPFEIARRGLGFVPEDRRIFSDAHRRRESRRRPPAAAALRRRPRGAGVDRRAALRALSEPRHHGRPARLRHERRRAADAHRRPHADGKSPPRAARRAVGRRRPGHRRGDGEHHPRAQAGGPVGAALRAERAFRRARRGPCVRPGEGSRCAGTARWRRSPKTPTRSARCSGCECSTPSFRPWRISLRTSS